MDSKFIPKAFFSQRKEKNCSRVFRDLREATLGLDAFLRDVFLGLDFFNENSGNDLENRVDDQKPHLGAEESQGHTG
jgi:hypothetical protein